ncbi:MAG: hypothetical protein AAGG72_06890 [Pseudomonadota bacterium]
MITFALLLGSIIVACGAFACAMVAGHNDAKEAVAPFFIGLFLLLSALGIAAAAGLQNA